MKTPLYKTYNTKGFRSLFLKWEWGNLSQKLTKAELRTRIFLCLLTGQTVVMTHGRQETFFSLHRFTERGNGMVGIFMKTASLFPGIALCAKSIVADWCNAHFYCYCPFSALYSVVKQLEGYISTWPDFQTKSLCYEKSQNPQTKLHLPNGKS